ncbi:ABC transporter substrate-binding protein [Nocardia stercoris]|nr:ABC transporter substrate-binding protein [Nocardia stercoris]
MTDVQENGPEPRRRKSRLRGPRRRWIAIAVVVIAVAAGVYAAISTGRSGGTAATPVHHGTLHFGVAGTQVSLDPAGSSTDVTHLIDRNIFDSLVAQTGPDTFSPWLATGWTVSPDGRTYRFTLREGVTFHDGTPFDATAVVATFDHILDPKTKSTSSSSLLAAYQETRIVDTHTVDVVLKQPFRPFLSALSTTGLGIQSPKALAAGEADYRPVGTGPFRFDRNDPGHSEILVRYDGYDSPPTGAAHTGPAYLDRLQFDFIGEDSTRVGALTSGELHGINGVPPVSANSLQGRSGLALHDVESPGLTYSLYLNQTHGPLRDPAVRRALAAAIDVRKLVGSIYFGRYPVADSPISRATADYDPTAGSELPTYDPAAAKHLLDQAGWNQVDSDGYRVKNGARLSLVWPNWIDGQRDQRTVVADGIRAQAKDVGIEIQRPDAETGTYIERYLSGGDYDIVDGNSVSPTPDVLRFAFFSTNTFAHSGSNMALVNSPQIDGWLTDADVTTDAGRAAADYASVQHEVLKQTFVVPIYSAVASYGVSTSIRGVTWDAQTYPRFYDTWLAN